MAKGEFIFGGIDITSYPSATLKSSFDPDTKTAGLTLIFLFVTVHFGAWLGYLRLSANSPRE
jgi:hypothetical protein